MIFTLQEFIIIRFNKTYSRKHFQLVFIITLINLGAIKHFIILIIIIVNNNKEFSCDHITDN